MISFFGKVTLSIALLLCNLGYGSAVFAQNKVHSNSNSLFTIGKVTNNPKGQIQALKPMADYISSFAQFQGGDALFTQSLDGMLNAFQEDKVDLFTGSAFEAAMLIDSGLAEPIALKLRQGKEHYRSIIVTRNNSEIHSLENLQGRLIGFEDSGSTSAYIIPKSELEQAGYSLYPAEDKQDSALPNIQITEKPIYYRFSESEQNSAAWLYRNIVDAIAISDSDWNDSKTIPEYLKKEFRIIYQSPPIPRAVEVIRSNLPENTKQDIQNALFSISKASSLYEPLILPDTITTIPVSELQIIMDEYHQTKGFQAISTEIKSYLLKLAESSKHSRAQ